MLYSYWAVVFHNYTKSSIKTSGSESRPKKVELASAHKKRDDYRKYFTHNNEACKNPYKTTLPHFLSLSTVVLNSRDWHENVWLPEFYAFQKQPFKITLL